MKVILDTNVFISGIFFKGPPHEILSAWRDGIIKIVLSPEILNEYQRVSEELTTKYPQINIRALIDIVTVKSELIFAPELQNQVCEDPDDDMFLACAIAGNVEIIVSGDKLLQKVKEYRGVKIITPRRFVDSYLNRE